MSTTILWLIILALVIYNYITVRRSRGANEPQDKGSSSAAIEEIKKLKREYDIAHTYGVRASTEKAELLEELKALKERMEGKWFEAVEAAKAHAPIGTTFTYLGLPAVIIGYEQVGWNYAEVMIECMLTSLYDKYGDVQPGMVHHRPEQKSLPIEFVYSIGTKEA